MVFTDGDAVLGMMAGSVKARDLLRDPRFALHSTSEDPPSRTGEGRTWAGDAKLAGQAVKIGETQRPGERFRLEISEAVLTMEGEPADHLVIESWHPGIGLRRQLRR